MARGGYRPGAGRPKKTPEAEAKAKAPASIKTEAKAAGLSPLDYMLTVMNDAEAEDTRRDRMAIAAAPFVHGKPGEVQGGVKAQRQAAGEKISKGGGKYAAPQAPKLVVDNR